MWKAICLFTSNLGDVLNIMMLPLYGDFSVLGTVLPGEDKVKMHRLTEPVSPYSSSSSSI